VTGTSWRSNTDVLSQDSYFAIKSLHMRALLFKYEPTARVTDSQSVRSYISVVVFDGSPSWSPVASGTRESTKCPTHRHFVASPVSLASRDKMAARRTQRSISTISWKNRGRRTVYLNTYMQILKPELSNAHHPFAQKSDGAQPKNTTARSLLIKMKDLRPEQKIQNVRWQLRSG